MKVLYFIIALAIGFYAYESALNLFVGTQPYQKAFSVLDLMLIMLIGVAVIVRH